MRVKKSTLQSWNTEDRKIMLQKLANFQIKVGSRDRQAITFKENVKECETINKYCPIYQIAGYNSPDDFIQDFEKGNINTNTEIGIALGTIILLHTYDKVHISHEIIKNSYSSLGDDFFPKTQSKEEFFRNNPDKKELPKHFFEMQENHIDIIPHRIKNLFNDYFIDLKTYKNRPYSRASTLYPTNVNKSIQDSKIQLLINLEAINTKKFDQMVFADGDVGDNTR